MQRCGLLMRNGAMLCVAMLAVLAGHPIVIGQEQPPLGTTLQDYWCWKKHICRGASLTGQCVGAGFFCLEGQPSGCLSKPGDGCLGAISGPASRPATSSARMFRLRRLGRTADQHARGFPTINAPVRARCSA